MQFREHVVQIAEKFPVYTSHLFVGWESCEIFKNVHFRLNFDFFHEHYELKTMRQYIIRIDKCVHMDQ